MRGLGEGLTCIRPVRMQGHRQGCIDSFPETQDSLKKSRQHSPTLYLSRVSGRRVLNASVSHQLI